MKDPRQQSQTKSEADRSLEFDHEEKTPQRSCGISLENFRRTGNRTEN